MYQKDSTVFWGKFLYVDLHRYNQTYFNSYGTNGARKSDRLAVPLTVSVKRDVRVRTLRRSVL